MNHPFIQMIKFEAKANKVMWIQFSSVGVILIAFLNLKNHYSPEPLIYSLMVILTLIFTLLSFHESTNKQSMNMYHLIPIDQDIKFITKISITLIAFPLLLLTAHVFFNYMDSFLSRFHETQEIDTMMQNTIYNQNMSIFFLVVWFYSHSLGTILAIVFKKYKLLYALLVYYGLNILIIPVILLSMASFSMEPNPHPSNQTNWIFVVLIVVSIALYVISFTLFKRRQI